MIENGVRPQGDDWQPYRSRKTVWARIVTVRGTDRPQVVTRDGRHFEVTDFQRSYEPEAVPA